MIFARHGNYARGCEAGPLYETDLTSVDTLTPRDVVDSELRRIKRLLAMEQKFVSRNLRDTRLLICQECPKYKSLVGDVVHICKECKCALEAKTWLANASCPLKKW